MKVKLLEVKVTFRVGLRHVDMSEEAVNELKALENDDSGTIEIDGLSGGENEHLENWLHKNIKLDDCYHLQYEIEHKL